MKFIKEENPIWNEEKNINIGKEYRSFNNLPNELGIKLSNTWLKLVEDNNELIGYGWIDYKNDEAEISVYVKENKRGKGNARNIIKCLEDEIHKKENINTIIAIIKKENENKFKILKLLLNNNFEHIIETYNYETMVQVLEKGYDVDLYKSIQRSI